MRGHVSLKIIFAAHNAPSRRCINYQFSWFFGRTRRQSKVLLKAHNHIVYETHVNAVAVLERLFHYSIGN